MIVLFVGTIKRAHETREGKQMNIWRREKMGRKRSEWKRNEKNDLFVLQSWIPRESNW